MPTRSTTQGHNLLWCRFPTLAKSLLAQQSYALSEPALADRSILCSFRTSRLLAMMEELGSVIDCVTGLWH